MQHDGIGPPYKASSLAMNKGFPVFHSLQVNDCGQSDGHLITAARVEKSMQVLQWVKIFSEFSLALLQ